jgi:hypothetical protein
MSLNWNLEPPPPSELADREIRLKTLILLEKRCQVFLFKDTVVFKILL